MMIVSSKDLDLFTNDLNIEYTDLKDGEVEVDKYHSLYLENFMNSSSLHFNKKINIPRLDFSY